MTHQASAARERHELALKADQTARRNSILEPHPAPAVGLHVLQIAFAPAELFHDRALVLVFDVDAEHLEGLEPLDAIWPTDFLEQHARTPDRHFVTLAPHVLEQDRQMQFAATGHLEDLFVVGLAHAHCDIRFELALKPLAQLPAGDVFAFAPGQRRCVDLKVHHQRRLIDFEQRQRIGKIHRRQRATDPDVIQAIDQHDVAGNRFLDHLPLEPLERQHLIDAAPGGRCVLSALGAMHHQHLLPGAQPPAADAADADLADVA